MKLAAHSMTVLFQGPCAGNQESLAHSRLWDAVVGFLHVFAHMQMKLPQVESINVKKNESQLAGSLAAAVNRKDVNRWTDCNILHYKYIKMTQ